jgi:8-oxo-dGTP pyrophosphatase MutT (NUDIX family)
VPAHRSAPPRSAGVVVVRHDGVAWRCLLLRAFRNWDFPKGLVEAGETPLAAALREAREETSLDGLVLRWGPAFRETVPYARGKIARYHLAESPAGEPALPISPALGRPEHHELRWTSWDEARRLVPPRLVPVLDWARALVEGRRGYGGG